MIKILKDCRLRLGTVPQMVFSQITGLQCRLKKTYIRVKLEPSSKEFKIVERLFRHKMKEEDVIVEIKRLQNPFLWEKYCR